MYGFAISYTERFRCPDPSEACLALAFNILHLCTVCCLKLVFIFTRGAALLTSLCSIVDGRKGSCGTRHTRAVSKILLALFRHVGAWGTLFTSYCYCLSTVQLFHCGICRTCHLQIRKEGRKEMFYLMMHSVLLFTVIWHRTYSKGPLK